MKKARLFSNGGSQAVRLPAEFRFEGDCVYVFRDPSSGDVVLTQHPPVDWEQFMVLRDGSARDSEELPLHREETVPYRDPFAAWAE